MYAREVTELIVKCHGRGLTAKETVDYIKRTNNITIGLQTVYRHRKSIKAAVIIEEILRRQKKDIADASLPLRLKYRDKLLDKLLPELRLIYQKHEAKKKVNVDLNMFRKQVFMAAVKNYVRFELAKKLKPELFNEIVNALETN